MIQAHLSLDLDFRPCRPFSQILRAIFAGKRTKQYIQVQVYHK